MKIAVLRFPGSNCDLDVVHVLRDVLKVDTDLLWHTTADLSSYDGVVLPGGFSYGDRLRAGVIAAHSPAMKEVKRLAKEGGPVLGICNGFQTLVEAGVLPGALMRNTSLSFICRWVSISVENAQTMATKTLKNGAVLNMPIAHNEGRYFTDEDGLKELRGHDQVVFTYCDRRGRVIDEANPNGSVEGIAGVCNREGNVVGLMPHPERASEAILSPFGTDHGLALFKSMAGVFEV